MLFDYDKAPSPMKNESVKVYYEMLREKRDALRVKRGIDILVSLLMIVMLMPLLILIAITVKLDSKGPVLFKQERITRGMKKFRILKFRTMVDGAAMLGPAVTLKDDKRITKVGSFLRKTRIDELPQLFNVLIGDMSFVGTRPEVEKYVNHYSEDMMATLLLPAGITSMASIEFRNEAERLKNAENSDRVYIEEILPAKMVLNLEYLRDFSLKLDFRILFKTITK
ncbi:MAG: sugar transferase [Ruminococcaceae bacterium]|nr:sugar transferase [Oscillospiraceae bacterium]